MDMFKKYGEDQFLDQLKKKGYNKLYDKIYLFEGIIQPEDVKWTYFKINT